MTQNGLDDRSRVAGLKQVHGFGVAQYVGSDLSSQSALLHTCLAGVLGQDVTDTRTGKALLATVAKQG